LSLSHRAALGVVRRLVAALPLRVGAAALPGDRACATPGRAAPGRRALPARRPGCFDRRAHAPLDRDAGLDVQLRRRPHLPDRRPERALPYRRRAALPELGAAPSRNLALAAGHAAALHRALARASDAP